MYQSEESEETLKQRLKEQIDIFKEQIDIDGLKSLSMMEKIAIIDKFFDDNSELIGKIIAKNILKDYVNVKDLAVGDRNIFYME